VKTANGKFFGNDGKKYKKMKLMSHNKRNKSWQLLFVDDHGRMISFTWLKKAAIMIIAALIFFMSCTLVLFILYHNNQKENIRLKETLDESGKNSKNLRYEMDMLLAKLVLAESKMGTDQDESPPEGKDQNMPVKGIKTAISPKEHVQADQEPAEESTNQPDQKTIVGVSNFKISQESGSSDLLKISFVIRNIDQSVKTASGYIFIILKQNENDHASWFSVPPTDLQDGYPIHVKQGQFFRISRFKTVYFRARNQISLDQLKSASVFVFDNQGKRIFEKSFPIERSPAGQSQGPEDIRHYPAESTSEQADRKNSEQVD